MRRSVVILFLILGGFSAQVVLAQKVFRGTVYDAETRETLPSVTLFDLERAEGTITNAAGQFELPLSSLPVWIDIRHIGYEPARIEITNETPTKLEIELTPATYTLDELVVSDEDPAYNIMRKVIEKKAAWQQHLSTYSAESYSRYLLYSDFDLAQVQESIALHHWKKKSGTRSYIRARRMRPTFTGPMRFASTQNIPNFYDDTIEIFGFDLVGPTHPKATEIYTFTLGGYHMREGKKVYDIYFSPKSGLSTAFIGHAVVLDEDYVLLKVTLRPSPDNVLPAPVQDWDVLYEQQFAPASDSLWLPIDLTAEGYVSFGRLGVSYPTARYRQVSRLTRHVLNLPVPDSLFASNKLITIAPNVDLQDHLFRWNPGLIPMTPKELEEVVAMDPRRGLGRSFRPIGVLANYTAIDLSATEENTGEEAPRENLLDGIFSNGRFFYNRVEGFYLGVASDVKLARPITLAFDVGYGLSSKLPAYDFSAQYEFGLNTEPSWLFHKGYIKAGLSDFRATQYASRTYSRLISAVTTYVGWDDYFDYFEKEARYVEVGFEAEKLQSRIALRYSKEAHQSIEVFRDNPGWFFGPTRRTNPGIIEDDYSILTASLSVGSQLRTSMTGGQNGLHLEAVIHPGQSTGMPAFTKYSLDTSFRIPTFLKRRKWPNALYVRLHGSTFSGSLPPQYASILDVSRRPIAPFGGFKTLYGLPIKGADVWAAYWEHDFSTGLFEAIGLWGVAQNGIGFVVHGAHGQALQRGRFSTGDQFSRFLERPQHELGISLTHFFNLPIRLDLTRNLVLKRTAFSVGFARKL